jgi:penicillin-binding protein 1A
VGEVSSRARRGFWLHFPRKETAARSDTFQCVQLLGRFVAAVVVAGLGLAGATLLFLPQVRDLFTAGDLGAHSKVNLRPLSERSIVYARDGSVLAVLADAEYREPVPISRVPDRVITAVLDTEDERFFEHGALDFRALTRALFTNVSEGGVLQGGSTITQQLVKNAVLSPKQSVNRKVREAALSYRLESQMTKREILERYLNTVYFGNQAYGIQAAARRYFDVDVGELTTGQAALLAGMIRNPVGYDPFVFPEAARARRDRVVDRMLHLGDVTPAEAAAIRSEPLPAKRTTPRAPDDYFAEYVKNALLRDRRMGETAQERYRAVFQGGLAIHTTLDPKLQSIARLRVAEQLPDTDGRFNAALVSVDPRTGAVRALVGGPGFEESQFNLVTDGIGRQPGSSFKMFTLVAAFEAGYGPRDTIAGYSPCSVAVPGQKPYSPGNYEGSRGGTTTLTSQTARSTNCAFIRLSQIVGLDQVARVAHRMGIPARVPIDAIPSMPLGSKEVHPLDMASAYATLAADGVYRSPYFVDRVEDADGKTIFETDTKGEQVISEHVARMTTQVLQEVVKRGTGTRARLTDREVAGKTGTAEENSDAWFVGYTPQLATAVWMGNPLKRDRMVIRGTEVTGGLYPARIWAAFMKDAMAGLPAIDFTPPDPKLIPRARYLDPRRLRQGYVEPASGYPTTRRYRTTTTVAPAPVTTNAPPASAPATSAPTVTVTTP